MAYYRIIGTLVYDDIWYCECKWCEGHGSDKTVRKFIDEVVKAYNESRALGKVLYKTLPDMIADDDDYEWMHGPTIQDAPPDTVMRLIGAPMLPCFTKTGHHSIIQ